MNDADGCDDDDDVDDDGDVGDTDGDGDDEVVKDLPTEESLLVKFSSRADIALVKGLLVMIDIRK